MFRITFVLLHWKLDLAGILWSRSQYNGHICWSVYNYQKCAGIKRKFCQDYSSWILSAAIIFWNGDLNQLANHIFLDILYIETIWFIGLKRLVITITIWCACMDIDHRLICRVDDQLGTDWVGCLMSLETDV